MDSPAALTNLPEETFAAGFDDADADVILLSSDGLKFRVYKVILARASAVFKDMFSVVATQDCPGSDPQVIDLAEDGRTLELLLRFCYPDAVPDINLNEAIRLVEASDKYMMDGLMKTIRPLLYAYAKTAPLRVFAIAYRSKLGAEVKEAAYQCSRNPATYLATTPVPELHHVPATAYQSLMRYHIRCSEKAVDVVTNHHMSWLTRSSYCWFACNSTTCQSKRHYHVGNRATPYTPSVWWMDFMQSVAASVRTSPPVGYSIAAHLKEIELPTPEDCEFCQTRQAKDIAQFIPVLEQQIEAAVRKVSIDLNV